MTLVLALRIQRQEDFYDLEASLVHILSTKIHETLLAFCFLFLNQTAR